MTTKTSDSSLHGPEMVGPGRKSSFSPSNNCVEFFRTTDPHVVAIRNSNDHGQGTLYVRQGVLAELLTGIRAGELDDLV